MRLVALIFLISLMLKALITRPEEDVAPLAEALTTLGIEPVVCPLLEIHYQPPETVPMDGIQAVVFTSKQGVRSVADTQPLKELPVFCVGDATAETAKALGFRKVISASGDVSSLLALIPQQVTKTHSLLYISGKHTAHDLPHLLSAQGYHVHPVVTYEASAVHTLPPAVITQLEQHSISLALFYSVRTVQVFESLLADAGLLDVTRTMHGFCLSDAVAGAFQKTRWRQMYVSVQPTQESLLESIHANLVFINP